MIAKLLLLSVAVIVWVSAIRFHPTVIPDCRVSVLDVGQGDAILIQTKEHDDILVDGGPDDTILAELNKILPPGDRDIELMVLTHPHADHVNGLVAVSERYEVHHVLNTSVRYHQLAYERWQELLTQHQVPISTATVGQVYVVGTAKLTVLWPASYLAATTITSDNAADGGGINDTSIVLKLSCGNSDAMLMGDASSEIEDRIFDAGADVRASLLKVGHHGSRFSSSARWLDAVHPTWAVISVGAGNHYQHPHPTTMLRLGQHITHILRTDEKGTITLVTDGQGGWITPP